ncbi:hypothetical protein GWK47_054874 [Chionoecetes opilio]|uniref:Uncharacterized protein n=1 Tax=Chionoecetes opilio TaxID=41210 RepID=A0A8J4Y4M9_CHIOP|nr:hypothetical protein GWK47_054874 [Chionoecetes opilio]
MRAMTRLNAGATFSVLRLYYVQAVGLPGGLLRPLSSSRSPPVSRSGSRCSITTPLSHHAGGSEMVPAPALKQRRDQIGAPRHQGAVHHGLSHGQVFRRDVEGVGQRRPPAGHDAGHRGACAATRGSSTPR